MLSRMLVIFAWTLLVLIIFESTGASPVKETEVWPRMTPDEETGRRVANWTKESDVNPEELGSYLEGDIMVSESTILNGPKNNALRWPDAVIPYDIKGNFTEAQSNIIYDAIKEYERYTCIRFKPRTNEKDYVKFVSNDTGCWSNLGKIGGEQTINLQIPGCVTKRGTVIHEIMHTVGFWHEHTRYDRDNHVNIYWNNIMPRARIHFAKVSPEVANFGVRYDYVSIMHFSPYPYGKGYRDLTIVPKNWRAKIGQRDALSKSDCTKINRMYNCPAKISA